MEGSVLRDTRRIIGVLSWLLVGAILNPLASVAAQSSVDEEPSIYVQSISPVGMRSYVRGRWGSVRAVVFNPTNGDREVKITGYIDGYEHQQYGRIVEVPARTRIIAWFPFYIPEKEVEQAPDIDPYANNEPTPAGDGRPPFQRPTLDYVDLMCWATDITDGQSIPLPATENEPRFVVPINFGHPEPMLGVLGDVMPNRFAPDITLELEAIKASRTTYGRTFRTFQFLPYEFPVDATVLEAFDQIAIMGPGLVADSQSTEALRAWVQRGGRLWIMLEHVDHDWLRSLLADVAVIEPVGVTTLEQVRWHYELPGDVPDEVRDYEEPIEFHRLLTTGLTTEWTVDGWPAVSTLDWGRGSILFTSIGSRSLMFPANQNDFGIPPPRVEGGASSFADYSSPYKLEDFLSKTSFATFVRENKPLVPNQEAAAEYVRAQLAYSAPRRGTIVLLLLTFCAGLGMAGYALARQEKLRLMLVVGPILSLCFAAVFAVIGFTSREATGDVVGELQLVQGRDGSTGIDIEATGRVFVTNSLGREVDSREAGTTRFQRADSDVRLWEQSWVDFDHWRMDDLAPPVGTLSLMRYQSDLMTRPLTIQATFDEEGLVGRFDWEGLEGASDALIRGEVLASHVSLAEDGTFRVSADQELNPGQYVIGATLSDEQQRRQKFLRQFFVTDRDAPPEPMFYVWGNLRNPRVDYEGIDSRNGAALHMAPLRFVSPPANTPVRVPQSLLRIRSLQNLTTREGSTAYAWSSDEWSQMNAPAEKVSTHFISVKLPPALLPLRLDKIDVSLEIEANDLSVTLLGVEDGATFELVSETSPRGTIRLSIEDPRALRVSADGEWLLGLEVGRLPETKMGTTWQVRDFKIDVRGTHAAVVDESQ